MALGYDKPLYLMAFDHRGSFEHGLFGADPPVSPAVHAGITDAKEVIFDAHLKALADGAPASACGDRDRKFLFELLVPATTAQLDKFEGHQRDYDRQLRPALVVETIAALQAGRVEPDIWKIEGLDAAAACSAVVAQARSSSRNGVVCIVLGRGADEPQVLDWVKIAAAVDGFDGFAVGRTLWQEALQDHLAGRATRQDAIDKIAARYRDVIDAYRNAEAPAASSTGGSP